jgi:hypothetical protein
MEEICEFRIWEKYAARLFAPNEGKRLGSLTRKVEMRVNDARFKAVGDLNASIQRHENDLFFTYWNIRRHYRKEELEKAELFLLWNIATFEPAGEECGTQYAESVACPQCKAGARQATPLFLDWRRIPKGKDIARTIAGEIVVSRRLVELFEQHSIRGAEFWPIRQRPASSAESKDWFQLTVQSHAAQVVLPTKIGINPFDEDVAGEYRCPLGDLIGLARLSEVWISRASYTGLDIVASSQFVGTRRGLLRPERFLLASPKLQKVIETRKLKGYKIEVAYLA